MRDYAKHQTRRSMQSRVGHVKVIPPGLLKCVALHCLQGDLLTQKDITHREIALRRKAPVRNYIARSIQFMNVHRLAASDAIAGSGVRTHDFKLVQSVPLLRLLWAQPGTKKSKAPLFNFGAVDLYRRRVADQANDEHQKAQCNGDICSSMCHFAPNSSGSVGQIVGTGSVCDGQDPIVEVSRATLQARNRSVIARRRPSPASFQTAANLIGAAGTAPSPTGTGWCSASCSLGALVGEGVT